jgi:hypothetical protein
MLGATPFLADEQDEGFTVVNLALELLSPSARLFFVHIAKGLQLGLPQQIMTDLLYKRLIVEAVRQEDVHVLVQQN